MIGRPVPRELLDLICARLGVNPHEVTRIVIEPARVTVERDIVSLVASRGDVPS